MLRLRRFVWLAIAMAVPLTGHADAGWPVRQEQTHGAAQGAEDAGPASLPPIEAAARARRCAGDFDEAASLRRRALRIAVAAFGSASRETVRRMGLLAWAYIDSRNWLDAEPLLIGAAGILPEADEGRLGAMIFAGLARVALARGETDTALFWAGRAVESMRRDPLHASTEPLRAYGAALAALERYEDAQQALDEALAVDRLRHGPDAEETARSLSQSGNLYLRWGRPEQALPLLQEAAAIDQVRLGPAHPFIADDLHDLGLAYEAVDRPERARLFFLAALAMLERGAERDTPRVAYTELALGRVERRRGRVEAAEEAERDARRILNRAESDERRRERRA